MVWFSNFWELKPHHLKSSLQKVKISNGQFSDPYCMYIGARKEPLSVTWVGGFVAILD